MAQVTVKHQKEFKLMHEILSYLFQTVQTLAKQDTQVVNLVLADQMDILEEIWKQLSQLFKPSMTKS